MFGHWKKVTHPQLGEVEVNGFDPRVGVWNPPYERLDETCRAQSAAFLRVAALMPRVGHRGREAGEDGGHTRIELRIANRGYLGTFGLPSAKNAAALGSRCASPRSGEGVKVWWRPPSRSSRSDISTAGAAGLYGGPSIFMPWTRGNGHERFVTLVAEGKGTLQVKVGSCRVGHQDRGRGDRLTSGAPATATSIRSVASVPAFSLT